MCSLLGTVRTNGDAAVDGLSTGQLVTDASGDGGRALVNGDVSATSVVECDSFCDFIRFEGSVTDQPVSSPSAHRNRLSSDDMGCDTLLRACVDKYKLLFEMFVDVCVLKHNQSLTSSFIRRFINADGHKSEAGATNASQSVMRYDERLELSGLTRTVIDAFSLACQLLTVYSALPIYSESAVSSPAANATGEKLSTDYILVSIRIIAFCRSTVSAY